jgi:hypothetical protein
MYMTEAKTKLCVDQKPKGRNVKKKELGNFIIRPVECINYARHSAGKWGLCSITFHSLETGCS